MPSKLEVTAGTSYDAATHTHVRVNDEAHVTRLESDLVVAKIAVRIQDFQGFTSTTDQTQSQDTCPSTSPYFESELHKSDRLSIQIQVRFKKGPTDSDSGSRKNAISGADLVWGNDFDTPIRDQLPYGFSLGYKILKHAIDPSIFGDVYSDKPYLYGPALTSFNKIARYPATASSENGDEDELEWPSPPGIFKENLQDPAGENGKGEFKYLPPDDSAARRKYFLTESHRTDFRFQAGSDVESYGFDFYTPYLDLGKQFAVKLPGFSLNVEGYAKGQPLRYTLKNIKTGEVYVVVALKLHKE